MLGKGDIPLRWRNIWFFLLFEDKGRSNAHHNRIKRGLLPGQSLSSKLERDCRRQELSREFRYSWLSLFNCWVGHKYPVPSSPLHVPRSWAHWPNRMEYFTPSPLETNYAGCSTNSRFLTHFLSDNGSVFLQECFILDGSATFHLSIAWDSHWNGCNYMDTL